MKKFLCAVLVLCLAMSFAGCGNDGNAVFVQSVESLMNLGGIAPGDRFPGMVVSENVTEVHKDSDKAIAEVLVREGDDVEEGQELFRYDMDQLQLALDKQKLELEQLKATIDNYKSQIEDLKKEEAKAWGNNKLQYTIQIQSLEVDLKESELNLEAKEKEVARTEEMVGNTSVVSPVTGRITGINENGYDNYGNPLAYITIQQAGSFRIKATLGELQRGGIMEGTRMKIVSRSDETQVWYGTVTLVDYESPSQGNDNNYYIGGVMDPMTSSSKYPFYVELDSSEGLLLGQHVYLELDAGEEEQKGISISSAFIAYDDEGNPYVWAEKNGKLEKRAVVLGEYDFMTDAMEILEGLTEGDYIAFPDPEFCAEGVSTTHSQPEIQEEGMVE
jgi:HlyD family secretion protein